MKDEVTTECSQVFYCLFSCRRSDIHVLACILMVSSASRWIWWVVATSWSASFLSLIRNAIESIQVRALMASRIVISEFEVPDLQLIMRHSAYNWTKSIKTMVLSTYDPTCAVFQSLMEAQHHHGIASDCKLCWVRIVCHYEPTSQFFLQWLSA